jgi:hypothetical protein
MIEDDNQMQPVLNFGWANWTQSKLKSFNQDRFQGEHFGYEKKYGAICDRTVTLKEKLVTIVDGIKPNTQSINIKQIWNTKEEVKMIDKFSVQVKSCLLTSNFPIKLEKTYISDYYNSYEDGTKIVIEVQSDKEVEIKTTMEFQA